MSAQWLQLRTDDPFLRQVSDDLMTEEVRIHSLFDAGFHRQPGSDGTSLPSPSRISIQDYVESGTDRREGRYGEWLLWLEVQYGFRVRLSQALSQMKGWCEYKVTE